MGRLVHSLTRCSLARLIVGASGCLFVRLCVCSIRLLVRPLVRSPVRSLFCLLARSSCLFVSFLFGSPVRSFVRSFVRSLFRSLLVRSLRFARSLLALLFLLLFFSCLLFPPFVRSFVRSFVLSFVRSFFFRFFVLSFHVPTTRVVCSNLRPCRLR